MAISDKVIDLEPVNKTKNIIMYVLIGVLAALAVTFVVLFIIKKPYEEPKVNSIQKAADTLNVIRGEDGAEVLYASAGNEYTVYAEVGAEEGADTQIEWRCSPVNAVVKIESGADAENPGRYFYKFRASEKADPSLPITLSAVSLTNPTVHYDTVFYVKEQNTVEMNFDSLKSPNKVDLDLTHAVKIPYFLESSSNKEYLLKVSQLGAYDEVRKAYVPLTDIPGTEEGKKTVSLAVEATSEPEGVLSNVRLLSAESDTVSFKAAKTGKATIKVIANRYNGSEEVVKTLDIEVVASSTLGYITKISMPGKILYVGDNDDGAAEDISIEPRSAKDEKGEWMKNLVFEAKNPEIADFYYRDGKVWLIPKAPGIATVKISDPTPDGLHAVCETNVYVYSPVTAVTPYYMADGKKVTITSASDIPATRGEDVDVYFDYAISSNSTPLSSYINNKLYINCTADFLKNVTLINSTNKEPYKLKGTGNEEISLTLTVSGKTATGMITFRFTKTATTDVLPVTFTKESGGKLDVATELPFKFKVNLKATSFAFKDAAEVNRLFQERGDGDSSFIKGTDRSIIRFQMSDSDSVVAIEDLFDVREPGATATFSVSSPTSYYGKEGNQNIYTRISKDGKTYFYMNGLGKGDAPYDSKGTFYYAEFTVTVKEIPGFSVKLRIELTDTIVDINASKTPTREAYYNGTKGSGKFDLTAEGIVVNYRYQSAPRSFSDYTVDVKLGNKILDKKESSTEATYELDGIVLFAFSKGDKSFTAQADLYGLSIEKGIKLDTVQLEYSTENGCAKSYSYTFIRLLDAVKIYSDQECTSELITSDIDRLILNRTAEYIYYPSGIIKYSSLAGDEIEYAVKKTAGALDLRADTLTSTAEGDYVTVIASDPCKIETSDIGVNENKSAEVRIKPSHGRDVTYYVSIYISVQYLSRPIEKIEILDESGTNPVTDFTLATDKNLTNEKTLTVRITYDDYTPDDMAYTMLDEIKFSSKNGYFALPASYAPTMADGVYVYTHQFAFGLNGADGKRINGQDTITVSSGMKDDASASVEGRIYTPVTAASLSSGGVTYTTGDNSPLTLSIDSNKQAESKEFTLNLTPASEFGLDYDDIAVEVTQTESGSPAKFVTCEWNQDAAPWTLKVKAIARADSGHLIVKISDKSADRDNPVNFVIDIPVTVEVATYALDVTQGGAAINQHIDAVTTGIGTDYAETALEIVKNGGDDKLQPDVDDTAALYLTDKNGNIITSTDIEIKNGRLRIKQSVLNNLQLHGSETVFKFYVTAKTAGGVSSASYPVSVTTTALGLRFVSPSLAGQDIYDINVSDGNKFRAEVYNRGSGEKAAATGTVSYALTAGGEFASIDSGTGELSFTNTAAEGNITVRVSYAAGADGITADPLDQTVKFYNYAKSVSFSGLDHYADSTLTMLKGDSVKLSDYLDFTGHRAGDPYYAGIELTLPAGLTKTGAGKAWTLHAETAGTYHVTLTVNQAGGENLTLDFTVVVAEPKPVPGEDKVLDVQSSNLSFEVPLSAPTVAGYTGSFTVTAPAGKDFFTVSGHQITLDPTKLTANSDYNTPYSFGIKYTVTGFNGFIYEVTDTYRVTVKTGFTLDFDVFEGAEKRTGNLPISGKSYRLDSDDVLFGGADASDIGYAVKEGAFVSVGANNALSFTGVGTATFTAKLTIYGYTYETEKEYTFVDETNLTVSIDGAEGTAPSYTLAADYAGTTPKTFKVIVDYSQVGLTPTLASSRIVVTGPQGAVTAVGPLTQDGDNKLFYQEYQATGLGSVTFDAVIVVGGVSYGTTQTVSIVLSGTAPDFALSDTALSLNQTTAIGSVTVTGTDGTFNGFTVESAQVTEKIYNNQADAGKELIALTRSGSTVKAEALAGTFGGKVKVLVTLRVSDGLYQGTTVDKTFEVTVTAPAQPTLTTADYNGFLMPGGNVSLDSDTYRKLAGNAGNTADYTYVYGGAVSLGSLSNGVFTADASNIAGGVAEITVTAVMQNGWWKGLTLTGKITVKVSPVIAFKDNMKKWLTAGGSATGTGSLNLSDAVTVPTPANGTGIVTYQLYSGDAAYISGTDLVSHMKGGAVKVRAMFTVTSGPLTGAAVTADSPEISILAASVGKHVLTPGSAYAYGSGGLDISPAPDGLTVSFEFFGKTQLSIVDDKLSVSRDANFTGADYTLPVGITVTDADGKVYYNEITFTVKAIAKPAVTYTATSNGEELTGNGDGMIYAGNTIEFKPDAGSYTGDITSVYLTLNEASYGTVSGSGTKATFTAAELTQNEVTVEITVHAVIYGQDYTGDVFKIKIGKQTAGVFKAEANKPMTVKGESVTYHVTPNDPSVSVSYVYVYHYLNGQNSGNIASWTITGYKGNSTVNKQTYSYPSYSYVKFGNVDRYELTVNTKADAEDSFTMSLTTGYSKSGSYGTNSSTNSLTVRTVASVDDSILSLTASAPAVYLGQPIQLYASLAGGYIGSEVTYTVPSGVSETGGKLTASAEGIYTVAARCTVAGREVSQDITVGFVAARSLLTTIDGADYTTLFKGQSYMLSLSTALPAQFGSVVYKKGNTAITSPYTPSSSGTETLSAEFTVNGQKFTVTKSVTVVDKPSIMVTRDGDVFTIESRDNASYSASIISGSDFGSISLNENKVTFTPNRNTKGGTIVIEFKLTFNGGIYKGISVTTTQSIEVSPAAQPEIAAAVNQESGVVTVSAGTDTVKVTDYTVGAAEQGYFRSVGISGGKFVYTLNDSAAGKTFTISVAVTFTSGIYAGETVSEEKEIAIIAPAAPSVTVNSDLTYIGQNGAEVIGYTATAGGEYIRSLSYSGNKIVYTLKTAAAGQTVKVTLTAQSAHDVYAGLTWDSNEALLTADAMPEILFEADSPTLTPANAASLRGISYTVLSGSEYLVGGIAADGTYTPKALTADGKVVVLVTAQVASGMYAGETLTAQRTITVAAVSFTLSVDGTGGIISTDSGAIVGYKIVSGADNVATATIKDGKITYTLKASAANTAIKFDVTVQFTGGVYNGQSVTQSVEFTAPAAPALTVKSNLTFALSSDTVVIGYTASAGGEYIGLLSYAASPVDYTLRLGAQGKTITASLTLKSALAVYAGVTAQSNEFTLPTTEAQPVFTFTDGKLMPNETGLTAAYTVRSGSSFITINESGNSYTLTSGASAGTVIIEYTAQITTGRYAGETLTQLRTITVPAAQMPQITLDVDPNTGVVTASSTVGVKITDYTVGAAEQGYFRSIGISGGKLVYTLDSSAAGRTGFTVAVDVTYTAGLFSGETVSKDVTVTPPAAPSVTVNGDLTYSAQNAEIIGYTATAGGEYIRSLSYDSSKIGYTLKTAAANNAVKIKLTLRSTLSVYSGATWDSDEITLISSAAPAIEFAADTTTLTPTNGADLDNVSYTVLSGSEYLVGGIAADGKYTPKALKVSGTVVVLVTAQVKTGIYMGETLTAYRTVIIPAAEKPAVTLTADNDAGTVSADIGSVVGYNVTVGGEHVATAVVKDGKLAYTLKKTAVGQTIKMSVTVKFTSGIYDGETTEKEVTLTPPALPVLTLDSATAGEITPSLDKGSFEIISYEPDSQGLTSIKVALGKVVYTLDPAFTGTVNVRVGVRITSGVFSGETLTEETTLSVTAKTFAPPTTAENGVIAPLAGVTASYDYAPSDAAIAVGADGRVLNRGALAGTYPVRVTATVTDGLYAGATLSYDVSVTVADMASAAQAR